MFSGTEDIDDVDDRAGRLRCTCRAMACGDYEEWTQISPDTPPVLTVGILLSPSLWHRHKKSDELLDALQTLDSRNTSLRQEIFSRALSRDGSKLESLDGGDSGDVGDAGDIRNEEVQDHIVEEDGNSENISLDHDHESIMVKALEDAIDDLAHISMTVNQSVLSFSTASVLDFKSPPKSCQSLSFLISKSTPVPAVPNSGPLQLDHTSPNNLSILSHEQCMFSASQGLMQLLDIEGEAYEQARDKVLGQVQDELQRIHSIKIHEWNRLVQMVKDGKVITTDVSQGSSQTRLNTGGS